MQFKRRKCKFCDKMALPNTRRCYDHFRQHQKELRMASVARQDARRQKKIVTLHTSLRWLNKQAWPIFSRFIRFRDMGEDGLTACYTCGHRFNPLILQAGHYFHGRLDYDERNVHPQCVRCNKWLHGNLAVYGAKLSEELGLDGMKKLMQDANSFGNGYNSFQLQEIIKTYSQKLDELMAKIEINDQQSL